MEMAVSKQEGVCGVSGLLAEKTCARAGALAGVLFAETKTPSDCRVKFKRICRVNSPVKVSTVKFKSHSPLRSKLVPV